MFQNPLKSLGELDQACKEYYLKSDVRLSSISIIAAIFVVPPMTYLDYTYYQFTPDFFETVFAELAYVIFSCVIVFLIRRNQQVRTYEKLVFTWSLATSILCFLFTVLQPSRVVENVIFCLLFLIANFITMQNSLWFRLIPATFIYLAYLALFLTNLTWFTFPNDYMFTLMLIMLTLVGMTVVATTNQSKLTTFTLHKNEQETRLLFEQLARTDSLTEIPNRRSYYEHAEQEWSRYKRYSSVFCVAILDLDNFKKVNDTYGHKAGDDVLRQFSRLIAAQTRTTDFFARVGGEEFGLILGETDQTTAVTVITRFKEILSDHKLHFDQSDIVITFSIGVAESRSDDQSLDDMIRRADQALYTAKALGRDRIQQG
jgi:diguanylate cyclase (GGDEF)-like protein